MSIHCLFLLFIASLFYCMTSVRPVDFDRLGLGVGAMSYLCYKLFDPHIRVGQSAKFVFCGM